MQLTKWLTLAFLSCVLIAGCKSDEDDNVDPVEECPLSGVMKKLDPTTSQGLFDVTYDASGRITAAGLQEYQFTYDAAGNVTNALLPNTGFNPQIEYVFSYSGNRISSISENWGEVPNVEERYVFVPTYGANGYIAKLSRTAFGNTDELSYSFDANGNALTWTDPTFGEVHTYTFGSEKGLVSGLTHNQAFAYGITINQPFFHFNNAVKTQKIENGNPQNDTNSVFSEISFNAAGFQTSAIDPNGNQYLFDYDCE